MRRLVATLALQVEPVDKDPEYWDERLRYLLDYADAFSDADELFEEAEAEGVVKAIAEIKGTGPGGWFRGLSDGHTAQT